VATNEAMAQSGNYLKIVVRNFAKNKYYAILNLGGLAIGFAVFILAATYVYFETHYENFHLQAKNIYRATYRYAPEGEYQTHWARIPFDYINELPKEVPGIKSLVRFQNHARKYVRIGTEKFRPNHAYVTDREVFNVFDFQLVSGNAQNALAQPHSVVISETLAEKYFGNQNALGKELYVIGDLDSVETLHHVTGVMKDLPANTHLPVDLLISFNTPEERSGWAYTYILLDGTDIASVEEKMPAFIRKHSTEQEARYDDIDFQPLSTIHLESNLAREIIPGGKVLYVRVIGFAGILILIVAAINFTNLSSVMSLGRAKEVGMRKVLGASRAQLTSYLLLESVLNYLAALSAGAGLAYLAFPYCQQVVALQFLINPVWFTAALVLIAVVLGLASGIYPVLLLTSLKTSAILKTIKALTLFGKENTFSLKRVLVTLQFGISILLIGSALIAYSQFRFIMEKNLEMGGEPIFAIPGVPDQVKAKFHTFRNALAGQQGIIGISACMEVPSREIRDAGPVLVQGTNSDASSAPIIDVQVVDHDFADVLDLKFVAGSNYTKPLNPHPEMTKNFDLPKYLLSHEREYIINETAMRQLGWTSSQDAIGQKISWSIGDMALAPGPIVGVIQDFHQESLKNKVDPLVMVQEPVWIRTFLIRINGRDTEASVKKISKAWNELFPFYPMEYYFLDDLYNNLYHGERVQVQLLFLFSGLAILIAFVGLVGLVTYELKTRTKEIAVRRVLGATVTDLVRLMGREYLIVLLIGGAISIPLSIYGINQWLSGFAYRVTISPVSYAIAILLIVVLLVVTVSLQTARAAGLNPANTLRDE
jgi:putative ABC transport system permease protein